MRTIHIILAGMFWLLGLASAGAGELAELPVTQLRTEASVVPLAGRSHFWIDRTEVQTVAQVEAAGDTLPWTLRQRGDSHDLDGSALWIQFDAQREDATRWFLELDAVGIDRVQFFFRGPDGQWVEQEAGDTKPVSLWPIPGRSPTFELSPVIGQPVRYWLRIEQARIDFSSGATLYSRGTLMGSRERDQFLLGGYFGLALLIALASAAFAIAYRDRNFAVFAAYVAVLAQLQAAMVGVGAEYLWEYSLRWNEVATFVLSGVSAAAMLWFAKTVTEPARYSRALDLGLWSLIAAILGAVALDTAIASRGSFRLVMVFTLLGMCTIVGLLAKAWRQGDDPHIGLISLGFAPMLLLAAFPIARGLNLIPVSVFTRFGTAIGAAFSLPILFYAINLRGAHRRDATARAAALARSDALTGLAHRNALMHRLEGAISRARSLKHACAILAVKIANHEAIAAEFGRDTADRVLVVAASLLRHAITDIDLAARVGEHDFALLLEGPTTKDNAVSRAQQVVASGLRSSPALPPGIVLKFHVTVAVLPERELDAAGTMHWLLESAGATRPDPRKLIRALNF
jgi:diguanylate cyclase (GGDEF)-like protein